MIEYSRIKKIHFVGIGGSGMSGIAEVLYNMGFEVTGSDIAESGMVKRLKALGIEVFLGHRGENAANAETLVFSSAVKKDNLEVAEALRRKIPVIPRAEMLAELMRLKFAIAVAGTHGKTSTTSMLAAILDRAGKDPTYVVGGQLKTGESGARLGKSDYLIAEADESDGSFLQLFPTLAVITNIEDDHLDYYDNMDNLLTAFKEFANKVPFYGSVILNRNCENTRLITPHINKRMITYSISKDADIQAKNIETTAFSAAFDLFVHGKNRGRVKLNVGGRHNVSNALAAIAVCLEIGLDIDAITDGLTHFSLPERRLQVLFFNKDYVVLDDYAHHPTEIEATLKTLDSGEFKRVIAVFQPHRYTRLGILLDKFASSFALADRLIIAPLYAANQEIIESVSSRVLYEKIRHDGMQGKLKEVLCIEDFSGILEYLNREIKKGDAVVFLTAGNLTQTAHEFAARLKKGG
ncbi:MAG: UDP-N-acetylmuramate--L-alanine ligase [Candidatus Aminicenantes bacterium]|nr:UDP-N-acetylmuramate--L-alanine ligase [Candidatus Aminicenantes bacterium]